MTDARSFYQRVRSAVSSGLKAARREFRDNPGEAVQLNQLQQRFVEWNAQRLGIAVEDSRSRFEASVKRFRGGHSGPEFRKYNVVSHDVFLPFFSDDEDELYQSYEFHSRMHFLRMLSYARYEPDDAARQMINSFDRAQPVTILDFGCGLAQRSRWIAESLREKGCAVTLALADIPTQRKDFLHWLCAQDGIEMTFLECSQSEPIPELPETVDICVATEFFEHVRDPIEYFDRFNEKMPANSWMVTNVADHGKEYMHVSPDLQSLRHRIAEAGFEELSRNEIFRKGQR